MIMGVNRCHLIDIIVNFKLKGARVTGSFFFAVNKGFVIASNSALPCSQKMMFSESFKWQ